MAEVSYVLPLNVRPTNLMYTMSPPGNMSKGGIRKPSFDSSRAVLTVDFLLKTFQKVRQVLIINFMLITKLVFRNVVCSEMKTEYCTFTETYSWGQNLRRNLCYRHEENIDHKE